MTSSVPERSTAVSYASMIDTRVVYGFLDAGKTTYIQDCILNDFFYKRGKTLILCFEEGEEEYDEDMLAGRNTQVAYYDGEEDVTGFCLRQIENHQPDRIYIEMNAMMQGLREQLPAVCDVTYTVTWLDWATLGTYFKNFRQMINQMVQESQQVTFRGCPSKALLEPYAQAFQLMNHKASYLREDPLGFHEKAFDIFLPYSLDDEEIEITEDRYLPFWLDAAEHPEHYNEKKILFKDPLELRHVTDDASWSAGRVVMTCCMSDLQFMSFELITDDACEISGGWVTFDAAGEISADEYRRKVLKLAVRNICPAKSPDELILAG